LIKMYETYLSNAIYVDFVSVLIQINILIFQPTK
jgi:hypothetical protein